MVGWVFFSCGTYWGGPGNVVMAKRVDKEIHPLWLRKNQAVQRMKRSDGRIQRLPWTEQVEQQEGRDALVQRNSAAFRLKEDKSEL